MSGVSVMSKSTHLTDETVVVMVRTQDKEIYAEIIRRYQAKLFRYAGYLLNDDHTASDVVQESFIKAYVNLNGFDVKKKFSSWIYRIVHNQAMNAVSSAKQQLPIDDHLDFDSGINLEDDVIKQELKLHARQCLDQIPLIFKEPLSLYYLEEKTYEEISDILHIPTSTVGTRINRAKRIMRNICQKNQK